MEDEKLITQSLEIWNLIDGLAYIQKGREIVILNEWQTKIWKSINGSRNLNDIYSYLACDADEKDRVRLLIKEFVNNGFVTYNEEDEW